MNLFNGRLAKEPQSLDAAYERHAMEQGLVDKPIFPENIDWDYSAPAGVWRVVTNTKQEQKMQELKKETEVDETVDVDKEQALDALLKKAGYTPQAHQYVEAVLQERGNRYGKFEDNARISQDLKDVCTGGQELHPVFKEALDNICQKIARVVNGDQFYEDNWVDIQGYAKLALDYIREHK